MDMSKCCDFYLNKGKEVLNIHLLKKLLNDKWKQLKIKEINKLKQLKRLIRLLKNMKKIFELSKKTF